MSSPAGRCHPRRTPSSLAGYGLPRRTPSSLAGYGLPRRTPSSLAGYGLPQRTPSSLAGYGLPRRTPSSLAGYGLPRRTPSSPHAFSGDLEINSMLCINNITDKILSTNMTEEWGRDAPFTQTGDTMTYFGRIVLVGGHPRYSQRIYNSFRG